jgi:NAD(P) transhydrogenase
LIMAYDYDLLCLGSGPAGQRAAVQAAKLGKRVAVIERRTTIGGVCVDTGTIPSKTFREAVTSLTAVGETLERQGLSRVLPRPSAEQLLARVSDVMRRERDVQEHQLRRNGVDVLGGCASFVDPHTIRVSSSLGTRDVTAAFILIAVGTRPASPPGAAVDGETILTSDDIGTLSRIPRTLAVVGAGVIGIEYASMFAALGSEVTVIDRRDRPLEFLDTEIVDELLHQMRKRNVSFRPGETVERLEPLDGPTRRVAIWLESGKRIVSDAVLFSVGRVGATDGLNPERAGLAVDDRGRVVVDADFRTSVPHIYAAGDVIGYPSLAATSSEQGRLAACHALGVSARPMASHFPIGLYAIPEVSMVGAPEHQLTKEKVPYEVGVARYREIARGQILGDESGFFKMLFHRDDRRLLGVHIIGTQATELLHVGQAVLGLRAGLDYFLETVFNYPTLAECYKVAALNAANKFAV